MENEHGIEETEALRKPFPRPRRFGFLRVWRRDSGISLALSVSIGLALLVVIVAFGLQWAQEDPAIPTIEVTAITLTPAERAKIDLEDPLVRTPVPSEAVVETSSSPPPEAPSVADASPGPSGLGDVPLVEPDTTSIDNAVDEARAALADADRGIKRARNKSAASKRATDQARASAQANGGDVPIPGTELRKLFDDRKSLERRKKLVARDGGSPQTESAVQLGLHWLATHQALDGRWSLDGFHHRHQCGQQCTHPGRVHSDTGATGLALLPFLGSGQTHQSGNFKKVVLDGLKWLVADQAEDGSFRSVSGGNMYAHGLATIALCEAWALTEDNWLRGPAQRAIDYIIAAQSASGGWRYTPRVGEDTSMIGWQMIALVSAQAGGLSLKPNPMAGASRYLNTAQVDPLGSQYAYTPRSGAKLAMTAEGLLCRQFLGRKRSHRGLINGVNHLQAHAPGTGAVDFYYWYYGTQVMHHFGGKPWASWNEQLVPTLLALQAKDGHSRGSWPPGGGHDSSGGRVYATALALCMLEVYYRHRRVFE